MTLKQLKDLLKKNARVRNDDYIEIDASIVYQFVEIAIAVKDMEMGKAIMLVRLLENSEEK